MTAEILNIANVTLDDQIKAAKRELSMRVKVYPRRIRVGMMSPAEADHEILAMRAILHTLLKLKQDDLF